jgi:SulP family sulfate permease
MDRVPYMDQSGFYSIEDSIRNLQSRNIKVVFTDAHGQPLDILERLNVIPGLVDREFCFQSFNDCSKWLEAYLKEKSH